MSHLEPYNAEKYSDILARIQYLINDFLRIQSHATPCHTCMVDVLYDIADRLNDLSNIGPSRAIDKELVDFHHLDKLSRRLLDIDSMGITTKIWSLMDRKMSSLYDTCLAGPSPDIGKLCHEKAMDDQLFMRRSGRRPRRRLNLDVLERTPKAEPSIPRAPGLDFDIIERTAGRLRTVMEDLSTEGEVGEPSSTQRNILSAPE
ncbi:MAG: hypothetical protein Q9225_003007 [Loekoesia sp. 1 TL-2023]